MGLAEDPKYMKTVHGLKNNLITNPTLLEDKLESGI
jgi:hypothetical protein